MHVEQVERLTLAERQVVAVYQAAGVPDLTMPSVYSTRDEFDAALAAEPVEVSTNVRMLRDLGVA